MMKKRNVAVAMAAMTIAGTVAPVFAAQESKETCLLYTSDAADDR